METTPHTHHEPDNGDRDFDGYLARISARFALIDASTPLFRVTVEGLFDEYIDRLANRQYHNCNACRQFFKNYATLVTVNEDGSLRSAIWDHVDSIPPYYVDAIAYVKKRVENATIESVFMSDQNVYGVVSNLAPDGKRWTHYAVKPHKSRKHTRRDITADQAIAAKTQDFETVSRALGSWKRGTMTQLAARGFRSVGLNSGDGGHLRAFRWQRHRRGRAPVSCRAAEETRAQDRRRSGVGSSGAQGARLV